MSHSLKSLLGHNHNLQDHISPRVLNLMLLLCELMLFLEYLENYIAFQQMKSPHNQNIVLNTDGIEENYRIAPMLLIPFAENSFKYSKIEDQVEARVEITLATHGNELSFHILNTYPENGAEPGSAPLRVSTQRSPMRCAVALVAPVLAAQALNSAARSEYPHGDHLGRRFQPLP